MILHYPDPNLNHKRNAGFLLQSGPYATEIRENCPPDSRPTERKHSLSREHLRGQWVGVIVTHYCAQGHGTAGRPTLVYSVVQKSKARRQRTFSLLSLKRFNEVW